MMSAIQNPKITVTELNKLEDRVKDNTASKEDYLLLDNYLDFLGLTNFILNHLKENNIDGYEDFILQRRRKQYANLHMLVGYVMGVISFLKKHISGKL